MTQPILNKFLKQVSKCDIIIINVNGEIISSKRGATTSFRIDDSEEAQLRFFLLQIKLTDSYGIIENEEGDTTFFLKANPETKKLLITKLEQEIKRKELEKDFIPCLKGAFATLGKKFPVLEILPRFLKRADEERIEIQKKPSFSLQIIRERGLIITLDNFVAKIFLFPIDFKTLLIETKEFLENYSTSPNRKKSLEDKIINLAREALQMLSSCSDIEISAPFTTLLTKYDELVAFRRSLDELPATTINTGLPTKARPRKEGEAAQGR